jgi:hypothetical protein
MPVHAFVWGVGAHTRPHESVFLILKKILIAFLLHNNADFMNFIPLELFFLLLYIVSQSLIRNLAFGGLNVFTRIEVSIFYL